jgi:hypothetical protein
MGNGVAVFGTLLGDDSPRKVCGEYPYPGKWRDHGMMRDLGKKHAWRRL